jgi:methionine biosynthesis protein MetW
MMSRADFSTIAGWITPGARVLDLGCGDGTLLRQLMHEKQVRGYGVEIDDTSVLNCVKNGVNVLQRNLEGGLAEFDDQSFDFVILSQTLQAMRHTEQTVSEMLRVGRQAVVTFPNFGFWRHRIDILRGRMPVSGSLPYQWYDTPNIHLCTLKDFEGLCAKLKVNVMQRVVLVDGRPVSLLPNLLGSLAVYRCKLHR